MNFGLKRLPRAVTTITPQRISFVGGGTDLPSFYREHEGSVISSAIDQYVYVTVKRHSALFQEEYRLSYSKTEHSNRLDDIENSIARECLRLVKVESPLYIATAADLPASSGLGSSSSFAVGLLHALHLFKGERVSPGQLAEEACEVEINILGNPIGKQDQYAAAFGGLNHMRFRRNGRVEIDHLVPKENLIDFIFKNSLLVWSGLQRDASSVLSKLSQKIDAQTVLYQSLVQDVKECKKILLHESHGILQLFGSVLESSWATKKSLDRSVSCQAIEDIHEEMRSYGSLGGKLCGAGGGGFLFEIVPCEYHSAVLEHLGTDRVLKIGYEPLGSRILSEVW